MAFHILQQGYARGILKPGNMIIEATSGNTGIALAMIGAVKGYQVILVMPECVSIERQRILEAFGAKSDNNTRM
jgi:cysteine synthase A